MKLCIQPLCRDFAAKRMIIKTSLFFLNFSIF